MSKRSQLAHQTRRAWQEKQARHPQVESTAKAGPVARQHPWKHILAVMLLVGSCIVVYARTLDAPMVFDDKIYLEDNPLLRDSRSFGYPANFVEFANRPKTWGLDMDLATNFILRPVAYLTFHINYVFGEFAPRWYRVVNIGIHAINACLIYALLRLLLQSHPAANQVAQQRVSITFIATVAALWFAVHPLATESVTYIVQRFTSLAVLFYLATLWLHFKANSTNDVSIRRWLRVATVVALLLGMLTKECVVTAPLMAVCIDWVVMKTSLRAACRRAVPQLLCLPLIPTLVLLIAWAQNGCVFRLSDAIHLANVKDVTNDHGPFAITQIPVIMGYLRLLVWPAGQNIDPDLPLNRSLLDPPVLWAGGLALALLGGAWFWLRRQREDVRCVLAFAGMVWFFGSIIISSGLVPLPDLMAEHRSYLPSIGCFIAAACFLDWLQTRPFLRDEPRLLAMGGASVITVALALATIQRNEVWGSRVLLWEDATAKSPGKARAWGNLGAAYAAAGRLDDSIRSYEKAREVDPDFNRSYVNLGTLYNHRDRFQEALNISQIAVRRSDALAQAVEVRYNMAVALLGLGRVDSGVRLLQDIVTKVPQHRNTHVALAIVYQQQRHNRRAMEHWHRAALLEPLNPKLASLMTATEVALRQ